MLDSIGLVGACVLLVVHVLLVRPYPVDDAYISFRVLKEFLAGHGLVYNMGERVEGYSNFLWMMLVAPAMALGRDPVQITRVLGLVCMLVAVVCTWGLTRRLSAGTGAAAVAAILMASLTSVAFWSEAGLETPLVAALIAAVLWSLFREEDDGRYWRTGVLMGLLALARPEMILVVGLALLWELLDKRARRGSLLSRGLPWHAGIVVLVYLPYTVWRVLYYGNLLPATVRAKSTGLNLHTLVRGGYYLLYFLGERGMLSIAALALIGAVVLWGGAYRRRMLCLALVIAVYTAITVLGGGDWMPVSRLFVHILPLWCGLAAVGAVTALGWLRAPAPGPGLVRTIAAGLLLLQVGVSVFDGVDPKGSLSERIGSVHPYPQIVAALRPEDTIMVVEAGWLPYHVPVSVRVVDMIGLANNNIANLRSRFPGGAFANYNVFGKWDVNYYLAQHARFVQLQYLGVDATGHVLTGFIGGTELANDPRFKARYVLRPDGIYERRSDALRSNPAGQAG